MAKKTALTVSSGFASQTQINNEFAAIAAEFNDKVLYRDNPVGEPNSMNNDLDMNSNRIINLPAPISDHEPARYGDIGGYASTASAAATAASSSANAAAASAVDAASSATSAAASAVTATNIASTGLGTASTMFDFGLIADPNNFFPTDYGSVV